MVYQWFANIGKIKGSYANKKSTVFNRNGMQCKYRCYDPKNENSDSSDHENRERI